MLWAIHFHLVGPSTFPQDCPLSPRPIFGNRQDSYFKTGGVTIEQFQEKLKQQDFFKSISDDNNDKKRLLEKDSKWARNFMCWGPKEADVIGKIERTLKWREEVSFISHIRL